MKIKTTVAVLLAALTFAACIPTATPRANNFALIFQYTPCGLTPMYTLDTASGTLVYTPLGRTASTTISLSLTSDELESIYQKAIDIDFWDYPSKFTVPIWQVSGYRESSASYELSMINGTIMNSVSWTDNIATRTNYTRVNQLRELMKLIYEIIQSYPEVQQLPRGALCL